MRMGPCPEFPITIETVKLANSPCWGNTSSQARHGPVTQKQAVDVVNFSSCRKKINFIDSLALPQSPGQSQDISPNTRQRRSYGINIQQHPHDCLSLSYIQRRVSSSAPNPNGPMRDSSFAGLPHKRLISLLRTRVEFFVTLIL